MDFWWTRLKTYLHKTKGYADWREAVDSKQFKLYFSDFLFCEDGAKSKRDFMFDGKLICGKPAPNIKVFMEGLNFCIKHLIH